MTLPNRPPEPEIIPDISISEVVQELHAFHDYNNVQRLFILDGEPIREENLIDIVNLPFENTLFNSPKKPRVLVTGDSESVGYYANPLYLSNNYRDSTLGYAHIYMHTHPNDPKDVFVDREGIERRWYRDSPSHNDLGAYAIFIGVNAIAHPVGVLSFEANDPKIFDNLRAFYLENMVILNSFDKDLKKNNRAFRFYDELSLVEKIELRNTFTDRYVTRRTNYGDGSTQYFLELLNRA